MPRTEWFSDFVFDIYKFYSVCKSLCSWIAVDIKHWRETYKWTVRCIRDFQMLASHTPWKHYSHLFLTFRVHKTLYFLFYYSISLFLQPTIYWMQKLFQTKTWHVNSWVGWIWVTTNLQNKEWIIIQAVRVQSKINLYFIILSGNINQSGTYVNLNFCVKIPDVVKILFYKCNQHVRYNEN